MSLAQGQDKPPCPNCGRPARLDHVLPKLGGLPEFKSYRCFFCNEVTTKAVENEQDAVRSRASRS
jgi:hypothetical protein